MTVAPPVAGGGGPNAHKYWRFHFYRSISSNDAAFTAMAFRDGAGSTISTSGGTAIESGHSGSQVAANLFDSNNATYWQHTAVGNQVAWCGIQFASGQKVRQVGLQITASGSMGGIGQPHQGTVEWSDDGVTWNPMIWLEFPTMTNDVMMWFDFTNLIPAYTATDFGAHTSWRMFAFRTSPAGATGFCALSAMLFKDPGGSAIASTGGTAIESSHFGAFSSANLFDSTDSTFWESNGNRAIDWAGYTFGSAKTVMQIGLQRHAATMDGSAPPATALLQYSDDAITWATAVVVDLPALTNDVPTYFNLAAGLPQSTSTFGSHACWKVQGFIQPNGFIALSAVLYKDNTGSSIATTGGTASDSTHTSTFTGAMVFDSTDATFWESGNEENPWVEYHFSGAQTAMQCALQRHASMDGSSPPVYCWFMYSDDGVVWQVAGAASTGTFVNDTPSWFDFSKALI